MDENNEPLGLPKFQNIGEESSKGGWWTFYYSASADYCSFTREELYSPSMVHGPMVTLIWAIAFTTTPLKYSIGTTVAPVPSDFNRIV